MKAELVKWKGGPAAPHTRKRKTDRSLYTFFLVWETNGRSHEEESQLAGSRDEKKKGEKKKKTGSAKKTRRRRIDLRDTERVNGCGRKKGETNVKTETWRRRRERDREIATDKDSERAMVSRVTSDSS